MTIRVSLDPPNIKSPADLEAAARAVLLYSWLFTAKARLNPMAPNG